MTARKSPREVLADRIVKWAGEESVYDYADRLIKDLDAEGWDFAVHSCVAEDCTVELGAHCERHGYLLFGAQDGKPAERMERTSDEADQLREDILAVLTVYDEHVAPENRGPWRERLETFADDLVMGVMDRANADA